MTEEEIITVRQIKVPIAGVTEGGKIYGTIPQEVREEINIPTLVEESDEISGFATIEFNLVLEHDEEIKETTESIGN